MAKATLGTLLTLLFASANPAAAAWPRPAAGDSQSGEPEVLFTFDDGPHERYTPMVLDLLAAHRIQAIFYWVGYRMNPGQARYAKRVEVALRAVREGHLVATHTVNHVHLCQVSPARAAEEIDGARALYEEVTGLPMILFRAPYGNHCRRLVEMLEERGVRHLYWDIDPREWEVRDPRHAARTIIRRLERLEGRAVILMHDTQLVTVRALAEVLSWIEEENLRRHAKGGPPIRILSGSELVAEQTEIGLARWLLDTGRQAGSALETALASLLP